MAISLFLLSLLMADSLCSSLEHWPLNGTRSSATHIGEIVVACVPHHCPTQFLSDDVIALDGGKRRVIVSHPLQTQTCISKKTHFACPLPATVYGPVFLAPLAAAGVAMLAAARTGADLIVQLFVYYIMIKLVYSTTLLLLLLLPITGNRSL